MACQLSQKEKEKQKHKHTRLLIVTLILSLISGVLAVSSGSVFVEETAKLSLKVYAVTIFTTAILIGFIPPKGKVSVTLVCLGLLMLLATATYLQVSKIHYDIGFYNWKTKKIVGVTSEIYLPLWQTMITVDKNTTIGLINLGNSPRLVRLFLEPTGSYRRIVDVVVIEVLSPKGKRIGLVSWSSQDPERNHCDISLGTEAYTIAIAVYTKSSWQYTEDFPSGNFKAFITL